MTEPDGPITIRRATSADAAAIAEVYLASFDGTYDFPLAHTDDEVRGWVRDVLVPSGDTWVAEAGDGVVAMMVVRPGDLDQLYVAPAWIGRGIGRRLLEQARRGSPAGLSLYTFQVNERARRFYERNGFVVDALGDGSGNEERQPDVRYVWRPAPGDDAPDRVVRSADGVGIAVFSAGGDRRRPIVLVHGATADHTTWRTSGPLLAERHRLHAIDRRGRGASGDAAPDSPYTIGLEFDDLVAVAAALARESGRPVDVVGHSYGGRIALGAALRSDAIRSVVCYEGAPPAPGDRGYQDEDADTLRRVEELVAAGDRDEALATFMRDIVGMPSDELSAFRANPIWARRAAAVDTTIRELRAEVEPEAGLEALGAVRQPVLQVLGGASAAPFRAATEALAARLGNGRTIVIDGARHAAHHTHAAEFVGAVEAFLGDADLAD